MARGRAPTGRFTAGLDTAQRDAEACRLRVRGLSYGEIATQLGYANDTAASLAIRRQLAATVTEAANELRQFEVERLNIYERAALGVLERKHVTVSQGRIIMMGDTPLLDDAPVLAAIDRLLKIQERRAKLLGLDAPTRVQVVTVDLVDAEIARLTAELAAQPGSPAADEASATPGTATTQG